MKKTQLTVCKNKSKFRGLAVLPLVMLIGAGTALQPSWNLALASPLLTTTDIVAIIVELAAGQGLDAWLNSNRDPREDRTEAIAVGAYYTGASYMQETSYQPATGEPGEPWQVSLLARRGNERYSDPEGDPIDELEKMTNLSGWAKTFELNLADGSPATTDRYTFSGTSDTSFSADDALEGLRSDLDDPSLKLGKNLMDKVEKWRVGKFVVYSDWSSSTVVLHPDLRKVGYYPAEMHYQKQSVDYKAGRLVRVGKVISDIESFDLRADRPDTYYVALCEENEMLLSSPTAYGGMERWVEHIIHECGIPDDPWLHLFPVNVCETVNKLVVQQERSLLLSEREE